MTFNVYRASQIDIHRLVSDSHCTATQLDRFPLFVGHQFIMLESMRYTRGCYLSVAWFRRRFVGLGPLFERPCEACTPGQNSTAPEKLITASWGRRVCPPLPDHGRVSRGNGSFINNSR